METARGFFIAFAIVSFLVFLLLPSVAFFASWGRGYIPALGWVIFSVAMSQIVAVMGWGDRIPWAVPALFSGMAGPRAESAVYGRESAPA